MPSSHDPVIRMFHCLFIVLKISLFSMPPVTTQSDRSILKMLACHFAHIEHAILHGFPAFTESSELIKSWLFKKRS
jgi:hypothetical protein